MSEEPRGMNALNSGNVFLMIRFRGTDQHEAITRVISETLGDYSLNLVRADRSHDEDELWANVRHWMDNSLYGIAVFEVINEQVTSPNVSLELGYMLAKGKKCLLLKERRVPVLQTDLIGHLCREFDADRIEETVSAEVRKWLRDVGISKRTNERWLVFISTGGTCRDPMAKAITLELLKQYPPDFDLQVKAFALGPPSKTETSWGARQAIEEMYGQDLLAGHRPTMISSGTAAEADLILVMDHRLLNPKVLPPEKTFVLKPFFGLEGDVDDPWPDTGDDAAAARYARCAAELKQLLETYLNKIVEFLRPQ
jgi:protein-tyrosine-phosphatase